MKRLLLFAVVATLFAACTQDIVVDVTNPIIADNTPETLVVGFEDDETRIQLNEAQKTVWNSGDEVSVFYKSDANQKYEYRGETGERTAELHKVSAGSSTTKMGYVVVAYPYNEEYIISPASGNLETMLPAVQHYAVDSYGVGDNLMVSCSEFTQFSLKSVCGWLKLQLTGNGEKVKSITLKGNNGEQVAGLIHVDTKSAEATLYSEEVAPDDNGNANGSLVIDGAMVTELTLDCGEGVKLGKEVTDFYIALPPQIFENGFTVEIEAMDGSIMTTSTDKTLTIERNHIQPMAAFAYDGVEQTNVIRYTATRKIEPHSGDWGANLISNDWNEHTGKGIITFDGEVTKIPNYAFGAGWIVWMKSIIIPSSVTVIGDGAFSGMSLNHGVLEDIIFAKNSKLEKIGDGAFKLNASLKAIVLPSSVKEIGDGICFGCGALKGVYLNNDYYGTWHFGSATVLYRYTDGHYHIVVFPSVFAEMDRYINAIGGATNIDYGAISLSNITSFSWSWIVNIASYNFANCDALSSVTLDRVETIGDYVLYMCDALQSIDLPMASVIGSNCFIDNSVLKSISLGCDELEIISSMGGNCPMLTTLRIPAGVASITSSFNSCGALKEIFVKALVPPVLTDSFDSMVEPRIYVPVEAFYLYKSAEGWKDFADYIVGYDFETGEIVPGQPNTDIWYTSSDGDVVTPYDTDVFGTTITSNTYSDGKGVITFDSDVTRIGDWAFRDCNITSIAIPNSVTRIGEKAFYNCYSLTSITIPDGVTSIGEQAFNSCDELSNVIIGDSVTTIDFMAFSYCDNLTSITIGDSVTSIGNYAFAYCTKQRYVFSKSTTPPLLSYNSFENTNIETIYVPTEAIDAYKTASYWRNYTIVGYDFENGVVVE